MSIYIKVKHPERRIFYVWGEVSIPELTLIEEVIPDSPAGLGREGVVLYTVYNEQDEYTFLFRGTE